VFAWLGRQLAVHSRGRPRRLLGLTVVVAAVTTAVLSLDATVVLLTPVVLATAGLLRVPAPRTSPRARTWPTPRPCCCPCPT
jgi:arsenical pump membrane protein